MTTQTHARPHRGGFTLIEILVVIGIILVLVGIVAVGLPRITGQSKEQQTRIVLENLNGMLAELDVVERGTPSLKGPYVAETPPDTVLAPRNVTEASYDPTNTALHDRYKSTAVQATRTVMNRLSSIGANQTVISNFSASQLLKDDPSTPVATDDESKPPRLLDAWGNPIIYVPAGGLRNVWVTVGTGSGSEARLITSPNNRPYLASAGPDGAFTDSDNATDPDPSKNAGDDNLYSFEN